MPDQATLRALDALPALVFVTDVGGGNIFSNARLLDYTGMTREALTGRQLMELVHPDDRDHLERSWTADTQRPALWQGEFRLRRYDGQYRWHLCRAESVTSQAGGHEWFGTCLDVQELREGDEAHAWLACVVTDSNDAIISKALDGTIRSWNPAAERILGYRADEAVGQPITLVVPPERHEEENEILGRLAKGERVEQLETERLTRDGRRIDVAVTMSPVLGADGRIIGSSAVVRDISVSRRAARAARHSEAKLNAIIERLPVGIGMMDAAGRNLSLNAAGLRMLGIESPDVLSYQEYRNRYEVHDSDGNVIPPEQWPLVLATRGEFVSDRQVVLHRPDDEERTIVYSTVPMPDGAGETGLFAFVMLDITQRQTAEAALAASRAELRLVTDQAAVMLAHVDSQQRFLFVNRTYAERLKLIRRRDDFEVDPTTIVGRSVRDVVGESTYARTEPFMKRALAGEVVEFETEVQYEGLGRRIMHCVNVPEYSADGSEVRGLVAVVSDVTERKALEARLREADRRKDEFLAILGHELRNPLAPIRTSVDLLKVRGHDPKLVEEVSSVMQRQLAHLVRLVDDLVDVSRITRGAMELKRVTLDLKRVVECACELANPLIEERQHLLGVQVCPEEVPVKGDLERLTQVVSNLLVNAAKYTRPGGYIRLRMTTSNERAEIRVTDNGLGIASEQLSMIFELFTQLPEHRERTSNRGLGIGLALSRQIVELHGGSIEGHSRGPGLGSEFIVSLPMVEQHREASKPPPGPAADNVPQRRILIVDDNIDAAVGLRRLLAALGHDVQSVYDGAAALDKVVASPPDIVLLDIELPDMDGYEVARRIRAMPNGRSIVLIALTGWGQSKDKQRAREADFDEHLTKPVDVTVLQRVFAAAAPGDEPAPSRMD